MIEKRNREFVLRDSRLTEMFSTNKDIQSAYNLCFSIFLILCATTVTYYLIDTKAFFDDISWLKWCFGANRFHILCLCWLRMQMSSVLLLYPSVRIWLWTKTNSSINSTFHNFLLTLFSISFQLLLFWFGLDFVRNQFLSPVCAFAFLCEQIRMTMKSYSFVEENRKREVYPSKDKTSISCPTLKQFLYFLVAPTLLYRDNYTRTNKTDWKLVFWYFLQVFAVIFMMFAITWRYVEHNYRWIGIKPFEVKQLIYLMLSGALIGFQLCVFLFYGFLHCWLNAFAEMLRFGDRQFYIDWWNCKEFATFYRKWNIVVHEWLRSYIFDISLNFTSNRGTAALVVFFVSAVIHEYLLALAFGFFLPVLFCFYFIVGVLLFFISKFKFKASVDKSQSKNGATNGLNANHPKTTLSFGNTLLFLGLTMGWSLMIMFYSMEWYSRINCPSNDKSILSYFWPQFLSCITIK